MNINFTPLALSDIQQIKSYLSEFDENTADSVTSRIMQVIMMFERFPLLGREGAVEETREFSIPGLPYIIVYKISSETDLDILTIVHERKKHP